MAKVLIYSTLTCPYCTRAKTLLERKGVLYEEIRVDLEPEQRLEMERRSGRHTVPQIFINDQSIGGCDDLYVLDANGRLDTLLAQENA